MPICPTCRTAFLGEEQYCPRDGSPLASAPPAPTDPLIGRVLGGRYRLTDALGQGGMGTVYRALHTLMDKPVAVKILRAELATDGEAVARFHREARSASRLDHDHCIRVTDFGQSDDGLLYLVMELLDGESLGQVITRGVVPPPRAAAIGLSVAEALAHAHEAGIIHRDLKPDNIFLARRPRGREVVKVLDFGLAKLVSDSAFGPSITRDGTIFGTPEYMAPEQAEGEKIDGRTDLYALGVILYQMVTGEVPFAASTLVALLTKQVSERPLSPRLRRPTAAIPQVLEQIILRCLEKRPEDRFANAQSVAEALEPFAAGDGAHSPLLPSYDSEPVTAISTPPAASQIRGGESIRPEPASVHPLDDDPGGSESAVGRVPREQWRWFGGTLGGVVIVCTAAAALLASHRSSSPSLSRATANTPLKEARSRLAAGDLEGAEQLLTTGARTDGDSVAVEETLADLAQRRGNALTTLVHLHRATRLRPADAEPHERLADFLLEIGQPRDACTQARQAVLLDPNHQLGAQTLAQARCKEVSP